MRRGRRYPSRADWRPIQGKQLRVIPRAVVESILQEPFARMEVQIHTQLMQAEAKKVAPIWQQEWLKIKENYPTFASSVRISGYPSDWYGVRIPKDFPSFGPPTPNIPTQIAVPKIPRDPIPYLTSEIRNVFPALANYIVFYFSDLNIKLPDHRPPVESYTISEEFRDIVRQATAHLTILRSNEKKKE